MNDKLQYATMLEIPVNTCNITYKPVKKRRKKKNQADLDELKTKVIDKINAIEKSQEAVQDSAPETLQDTSRETSMESSSEISLVPKTENLPVPIETSVAVKKGKIKKKFKPSLVGVGIFAVCALVATILLTNAIVPNSGINTFFRSVFGQESQTASVDDRKYSDFNITIPANGTLNNGVIALPNGSVYSPANGKVTSLDKEADGTFSLQIEHNGNFSTLISGLTFCNFSKGDTVYATIPVGFSRNGGAKMCFVGSEGAIIANYTINDGAVVWES